MQITRLPWEIVSKIVQNLDLNETWSFSLSCRHFQSLLQDDNTCRRLLELRAPSAPETQSARETKQFARELRRLVKRRDAVSSASPYLVAVVAEGAESFVYSDGVICYVHENRLRVLDLLGSATREIVVDVRALLSADGGLPSPSEQHGCDFKLVHYSHGYLTCRYSPGQPHPGRLVVVNLAEGRVFSRVLESAHKLFARNDHEFLYYGTHTDNSDTDHHRWEVRGCNLREEAWFEHKLLLIDIVSSEVGTDICFEIIDGFFYCIANKAPSEREEIAWTSYYTYLRFPVNRPEPLSAEAVEPREMWRRLHAEGPIDDRWTFLRLSKDETTGALTVVEGRKEWINGSSKRRRTYYSSELDFAGQCQRPSWTDDDDFTGLPHGFSLRAGLQTSSDHDASYSKIAATESRSRSPHNVHPGDDPTSPWTFPASKPLLLSYHPACQTYLDLVNDPLPTDPDQHQRLRLRSGSRRLRYKSEIGAVQTTHAGPPDNPLYPENEIHRLYKASDIVLWPPGRWEQEYAADLEELYSVLNPPGYRGGACATWDERSLCYAAGQDGQTLVFVSFDPSVRLQGVKPWPGTAGDVGKAVGDRRRGLPSPASMLTGVLQGTAPGCPSIPGAPWNERLAAVEVPPVPSKGKGTAAASSPYGGPSAADVALHAAPVAGSDSSSNAAGRIIPARAEKGSQRQGLFRTERPQYSVIQKGFHFMS